jgi:hypothetical protein
MTPESTLGNLCGSRMESVIGMTYETSTVKHHNTKGDVSLPSLYLRRRRPPCYKQYPMRRADTAFNSELHTQSEVGNPWG